MNYKNIKENLNLLIRKILRIGSAFLRIFPVKKNRILFMANFGNNDKYACNPKYIHEYMKKNYGDEFEYVWVFIHPEDMKSVVESKLVSRYSLKLLYMMSTSKVVLFNVSTGAICSRRRNQLFINTWHGGGAYKCIDETNKDTTAVTRWTGHKLFLDTNVCLSSSRMFTKVAIEDGQLTSGEVWNTGMPRNDIFFNQEKVSETSARVKQLYGIKGYTVLYAPTFRGSLGDAQQTDDILDFDRLMSACHRRFEGEVSLLVRTHAKVNAYSWQMESNIIDVTDYPDMQELLCAADMLITDYSSSIWDYALLGRPCMLYVPDLETYEKERGLCTPVETWPGIVCKNMDEMCSAIENLDEEYCAEKARNHLEYLGSYENGTACETVCKRIVEFCRGTNEKGN